MLVDVPVSAENASTTNANRIDTSAVPMNFCAFEPERASSSDLQKSSTKPTRANPTVARTSASPAGLNVKPAATVNRVAR